jgi:CDP-4-dehydro-6-deoxyglucose reductase, E3
VSAAENVLAAALAAGIPLPHSCRAGRCATCKARLISGVIAYPHDELPPGITAAEAARGEVLLCQARPRSDLVIESRRASMHPDAFAEAELLLLEPLPLQALRVRARLSDGALAARPGQFADLRNAAGDEERLAIIDVHGAEVDLEALPDGSRLREWLDGRPAPGTWLWLAGPFDRPR